MTWMNNDGLLVKFGLEQAADARGGEVSDPSRHEIELIIDWTDVQSTSNTVLGAIGTVDGGKTGSFGVMVPKGARIERVETIVQTAFTSSGTIGTSTLVVGLIKSSDRSTDLVSGGFTTTAFTGTVAGLATVGSTTAVVVGSTGAGTLYGTNVSENGVIAVANSQHASHPFTAGKLKMKIFYSLPQVTS